MANRLNAVGAGLVLVAVGVGWAVLAHKPDAEQAQVESASDAADDPPEDPKVVHVCNICGSTT